MNMKRIVALVLAMVMALSLAACGGSSAPAATAAPAAAGDAAPADTAAAASDGDKVLNVMVEVEVESLDPQVATDGTTEEIFTNPVHPYTRSLLSAIPSPNPRVEKNRVAESYDYATSGIDYHAGTLHTLEGTHQVLGTDEEIARWLAK